MSVQDALKESLLNDYRSNTDMISINIESNMMDHDIKLKWDMFNEKLVNIFLCHTSVIKNNGGIKCCNLMFGLIFPVIVMLICEYYWYIIDIEGTFKEYDNQPISLTMRIIFSVSFDVTLLLKLYYFSRLKVHPYTYFDVDIIRNITVKYKIIIWITMIMLVICAIGINVVYVYNLVNSFSLYHSVNVIYNLYGWYTQILGVVVIYTILLYGLVTIKSIYIRLSNVDISNIAHENTILECIECYDKYRPIYNKLYPVPSLIWNLQIIPIVCGGIWLSFKNLLNHNGVNNVFAITMIGIGFMWPYLWFLCQHTLYYYKIKKTVNDIITQINKNNCNYNKLLKILSFKQKLIFTPYNGHCVGYEISYFGIVKAILYFIFIRIIALLITNITK